LVSQPVLRLLPLPRLDYPWCVSRENYLDCFYATHQQCQATASGIGGCAPNPRLLFPQSPQNRAIRPRW
jgi:hypothetical protein